MGDTASPTRGDASRKRKTLQANEPHTRGLFRVTRPPLHESREGAARTRTPVGIARILRAGSRQGHSRGRICTAADHTSHLGVSLLRAMPNNPSRSKQRPPPEQFSFSYAGSNTLRSPSSGEKPRRLMPAARNTETRSALATAAPWTSRIASRGVLRYKPGVCRRRRFLTLTASPKG